MKTTYLAVLLSSVMMISACNSSSDSTTTSKDTNDKPASDTTTPAMQSKAVATVNGHDISEHTLDAYMQQRLAQVPEADTPGARRKILDEAINIELAIQDAMNKHLEKDPFVALELETQRRNILASAAFADFLKKHPTNDADLKKIYEERIHAEDFRDYKVRHILTDSEDKAKALIAKLNKGADFIELAKTASTGPSAAQGGDLGWLNSRDILPELLTSVQKLDKGKYTTTPVKTQFGWHIVKLDDVKQIPVPAFDKVKQELLAIAQRESLEKYLAELHKDAKIVIHDKFQQTNDALNEKVEGKQ